MSNSFASILSLLTYVDAEKFSNEILVITEIEFIYVSDTS